MGIFGSKHSTGSGGKKKPPPTITDKDRAILDLKNARDRLSKFQKKLNVDSDKLQLQAKELVQRGLKDRALLLLKLRKHKMQEAEKVDGQLLNVVKMIEDVEWESAQVQVLKALEQGNSALKSLHEEMSLERAQDIMSDTEESMELVREMDQLLMGQFSEVDEQALEKELQMLEEQQALELGQQLPDVPATPVIPQSAEASIPESKEQEEQVSEDAPAERVMVAS